jgi:branched-chain amino acid aminotransferase
MSSRPKILSSSELSSISFPKLDPKELGFGKYFGPVALTGLWKEAGGWGDFKLEALKDISLHPAASVLQYAQTIFEGMKAFHGVDGKIRIFRSSFHAERFRRTAERLCLPTLSSGWFESLVREAVVANRDIVPKTESCSLYIRPTLFGVEAFLGVRPSREDSLIIMTSPVGAYYASGRKELRIMIEREDVRASVGGLGAAKTGANYAASLRAGVRAQEAGFDQVLWLDARERKYVEEVGTMNLFFVIKDVVVTPALSGSILPGCTRDSSLLLLRHWGYKVEERAVSLSELFEASRKGELTEAFGTGTAAVIAPVGEFVSPSDQTKITVKGPMPVAERLYNEITGIQTGRLPDPWSWTEIC